MISPDLFLSIIDLSSSAENGELAHSEHVVNQRTLSLWDPKLTCFTYVSFVFIDMNITEITILAILIEEAFIFCTIPIHNGIPNGRKNFLAVLFRVIAVFSLFTRQQSRFTLFYHRIRIHN